MSDDKFTPYPETWFNLPALPEKRYPADIYSERIVFRTILNYEFKGWVRFDFENFIVEDRQLDFEYKHVHSWRYSTHYEK